MKQIAKRGFVLLLALVLCLPLGGVPMAAADDTPLAGVDGVVDIWKWKRVKTQADLPDDKATRTVGNTTETYDHALLLVYEWKGKKYFMNAAPENRKTSRGVLLQNRFFLPPTELPEGVDTSLDTFRTKGNIGHMSLRPTGKTDSDNGNCKIYNMYADDRADSPLYLASAIAHDDRSLVSANGFCFSEGGSTDSEGMVVGSAYVTGHKKYLDLSFCTHDASSSHVSDGMVKIFKATPRNTPPKSMKVSDP